MSPLVSTWFGPTGIGARPPNRFDRPAPPCRAGIWTLRLHRREGPGLVQALREAPEGLHHRGVVGAEPFEDLR